MPSLLLLLRGSPGAGTYPVICQLASEAQATVGELPPSVLSQILLTWEHDSILGVYVQALRESFCLPASPFVVFE